jgi:two-component system, NtrC family, response regulator AtoC
MQDCGAAHVVKSDDKVFVAGLSSAVQALETAIREIALTNIPVLLVGENGTGKEVFAHRIHQLSACREEPFLKISSASLSPTGFYTELGLNAKVDPAGRGTGTVFFDEISELDTSCQRNLLYALPDGDGAPPHGMLTARIVSATSRNLHDEMRAGRFRSELYYRIDGMCLRIPALRERKEDIPVLVEWFLTKHAEQMKRPRPSLSPSTLRLFLDHSWPGNIRELENVVRRIVALGDERLAVGEMGPVQPPRAVEASPTREGSLKLAARAASREAERELILKALSRTHWNRKRAAQELRISYKSLLYKLKQIAFEGESN